MGQIVVLGAGLAGLGFARTLPGARIFEAKEHPGGRAYSYCLDGYFFDQGTHISHTKNRRFLSLIYQQAGDVHQIQPSIVSNYWHGLWLKYPIQNHLHGLPLDKRVAALTDLVMAHINHRPKEASNYAEWCVNQYGTYLSKYFYREFTEKYWRVHMEELATDWLEGRLLPSEIPNIIRGAFSPQDEKQASFSKFHYPVHGGFFGFFKSLADDIDIQYNERAVEIDVNTNVITFESGRKEHYDVLASSIPLPELVTIIKEPPTSVRSAAALLRHTKLLCVNMVISKQDLAKNHWCYIYDHEIGAARVSFPSNLAPTSVEDGTSVLQAEIFRRHDEDWDVNVLADNTVKEMARLFGFNAGKELVSLSYFVVPYAYPISDLHREAAVTHMLSWLRKQNIFAMGLYGKWRYIWSDLAYYSGVETAKEVREYIYER